MQGGSCNDYDYTCGDPVNGFDLGGLKAKPLPNRDEECNPERNHNYVDTSTGECGAYRAAALSERPELYWDYLEDPANYFVPQFSHLKCPKALKDVVSIFGIGGFFRAANGDFAYGNTAITGAVGETEHAIGMALPKTVAPLTAVTAAATFVDAGCVLLDRFG